MVIANFFLRQLLRQFFIIQNLEHHDGLFSVGIRIHQRDSNQPLIEHLIDLLHIFEAWVLHVVYWRVNCLEEVRADLNCLVVVSSVPLECEDTEYEVWANHKECHFFGLKHWFYGLEEHHYLVDRLRLLENQRHLLSELLSFPNLHVRRRSCHAEGCCCASKYSLPRSTLPILIELLNDLMMTLAWIVINVVSANRPMIMVMIVVVAVLSFFN